jgi:hypothetical protein
VSVAALVAAALLLAPTSGVAALTIKVGAQQEECISDVLYPGGSISTAFAVTHGGKLDINAQAQVRDLKSDRITHLQSWQGQTEGSVDWTAPLAAASATSASVAGPYMFSVCFDNRHARWTPKWVNFEMYKMIPAHNPHAADDGVSGEHNKAFATVEQDLHKSATRVFNLRSKMQKLKQSEEEHRNTIEAVVSWIVWGGVVNCLMLCIMAIFQFVYLKNFLAVRSVMRV